MPYFKHGTFDRAPINNPISNNAVPQQSSEIENSDAEIDGWVVLATILLSVGAVYLFVSYIDSPLETARM
jgi:hypothetical protein